jgi:hypothetical protein
MVWKINDSANRQTAPALAKFHCADAVRRSWFIQPCFFGRRINTDSLAYETTDQST